MSVRLVTALDAAPGKGAELAQAFRRRRGEVMQEPGCGQFEVFQSAVNPNKLVLLELNKTRTPLPPGLRIGNGKREDYIYN